MGKHSAPRRKNSTAAPDPRRSGRRGQTSPRMIEHLDPATESRETHTDAARRQQRPDYMATRRKRKNRRKAAVWVLVAILALVVVGAAGAFIYVKSIDGRLRASMNKADPSAVALLNSQKREPGEPFNMIIMGTDNREGETSARSDTLIVAHIDPKKKSATLMSIPRDSRVDVPGHGTTKINAAAAYGGPSLVIKTVEAFTGMTISHYVEVDFNGFKDLVDALGGVTVNVPSKIQDPKAGNYDASAYTLYAGEQLLNGKQALTFVRSRQFPEGDIARIRNQQVFIKAIFEKILKFSSAFKINAIVEATIPNVTTDLSVGDVLGLMTDMKGMQKSDLETVTMPGTPKYIGGVSYVVPDLDGLKELVDRIENGQTAAASTEGTVTIDPTTVTVDVRNGAGLASVASEAASRLTKAKLKVTSIGNTNQFVYDKTLIVYKDDDARANLVRESLGMGDVIPSRGMYTFTTDVLVVVGKDWKSVPTSSSN